MLLFSYKKQLCFSGAKLSQSWVLAVLSCPFPLRLFLLFQSFQHTTRVCLLSKILSFGYHEFLLHLSITFKQTLANTIQLIPKLQQDSFDAKLTYLFCFILLITQTYDIPSPFLSCADIFPLGISEPCTIHIFYYF